MRAPPLLDDHNALDLDTAGLGQVARSLLAVRPPKPIVGAHLCSSHSPVADPRSAQSSLGYQSTAQVQRKVQWKLGLSPYPPAKRWRAAALAAERRDRAH